MSNTIQIKRGNGAPSNGALKIGELGLDLNTNTLYVGQATDQSPSAAAIIPFAKVALSSFGSQTANYVLAAPNGSNGTPTFRALVVADIPNLNASKITSGTLAIAQGGTGATTAAINTIFAGPGSGSTAAPSFRALVAADVPDLNASKITAGTFDVARIPNLSASKITSGTLAVANGGTGLTSLATFVRTTGDQTIGGQKTFTNNPYLERGSSGDTFYYAKRTDTDVQLGFGIGTGGQNHGIYSHKQGRWLIHGNATDVYVAGSLYHKITIGTADPSGGSNGDIYIKYTT